MSAFRPFPATLAGTGLIRLDLAFTAGWAGIEIAAVVWPDSLGSIAAAVSLALFAIGSVVFLRAFMVAVDRSRTEEISVAGLYLLMGQSAPPVVRRWLLGLLAAQVVLAVAAAAVRPFTALAFGILVPMFGLAIPGLWAAHYGAFADRTILRTKRAVRRPADEEDFRA